ncbi:oxygenase MpaB family protein [uncultured Corynebacterium sp.]|uniref:oxygenase MpaB family protein n=1 Tax=uncultured Corynebacterium sp. TaxID=159447 RepID=UPI0025D818EC|nr:oxygenase MpaB family protein [uncultured Corynebacterium sp.]
MTTNMSLGTVGEWPAGRGDKEEFIATFGQERADRYHEAFWKMDPVADALFTSGHTVKEIMPNLRDALARGTANEDTFPEVAALIEDMTKALDGIDAEKLERGRRVYLSIPPLSHGLALGPGSLVHTYSTPAIADLLVNTGELTDGAVKRLAYTTNWTYSLYLPDALQPGGEGFIHTGMVRAIHAHVRRVHTRKELDYSHYGAPISEFDMLRTWFDFTYIPYAGLRNMGWKLTAEEEKDAFYLWKIAGRMLGISTDLFEGEDGVEASQETMDAIHTVDGEINESARKLVDALMDGFVVNAKELTGMPDDTLADWTAAHVRIIHGDEVADACGVADSVMRPILQMEAPLVQERFDLLRQDSEALEAEIQKNEEAVRQMLTRDATYMKQDEGIKMKDGSVVAAS